MLIVGGGCSGSKTPALAPVRGVVTLDGAPYPNAKVTFTPAKGRPSEGVTDSAGKYELTYLPMVKGAEIGTHTVTISTQYQAPENPPAEPPPPFVDKIPARYNTRSGISAEVVAAGIEIDFPLKTQ